MFDLATLPALAATTVSLLTPLLQKALEKGAEEAGKSVMTSVLDGLKKRLSHAGAKEALEDLEREPDSKAAQGALEMQLRKALQADPDLVSFLREWAAESAQKAGISQSATLTGDNSKIVQITGSGNSVS